MSVIATLRNSIRPPAVSRNGAADPRSRPWRSALAASTPDAYQRVCNICGWHGTEFLGPAHCELADCPHCASIGRDRFLYWCWTQRVPYDRAQRVLETSPRLDKRYRRRMSKLVRYTASDYDESAHKAMIKLDLQDMDLPDNSIDTVLTPHVLEHVPDTERALSELHRVLAPGGSILIMIPMPQGVTGPPTEPEYHGDSTLVYWRFGWDLRDKLTAAGFDVTCLVTQSLVERVSRGDHDSGYVDPHINELDLLRHADPSTLTPVANDREAQQYGFEPDLQFIAWQCVKPAA